MFEGVDTAAAESRSCVLDYECVIVEAVVLAVVVGVMRTEGAGVAGRGCLGGDDGFEGVLLANGTAWWCWLSACYCWSCLVVVMDWLCVAAQ